MPPKITAEVTKIHTNGHLEPIYVLALILPNREAALERVLGEGFEDPTPKQMRRIAASGMRLPTGHTFHGRGRDKKGHCVLKHCGDAGKHVHSKRKILPEDSIIILVKVKK